MRPDLDHVSPRGGRQIQIALLDPQDNRRKCRSLGNCQVHGGGGPPEGGTPRPSSRARRSRTKKSPPLRVKPLTTSRALDQFYTDGELAAGYLRQLAMRYDLTSYVLVEPSAGRGAFSKPMPRNSVAFDIDPKDAGIIKMDFLSIELRCVRGIMTIGNPPFGPVASLAVKFFNHAARQSDVIAMIFPRSFLKAYIENKLDPAFHLIHCEEVPPNSFELDGERRDVGAVFQIWERHDVPRELRVRELDHPDFKFNPPGMHDFAIRRVGANAGEISHDQNLHEDSYYFIKGNVEHFMAQLDLRGAARKATSTPSLARSEIVALYRQHIEGVGGCKNLKSSEAPVRGGDRCRGQIVGAGRRYAAKNASASPRQPISKARRR